MRPRTRTTRATTTTRATRHRRAAETTGIPASPEETAATDAPDPFPASRLDPGAARARTEDLFREHGRLVIGLCRGLLRDAEEAEDAAQQAFLSVHAAFLRGAEPNDSARWLSAIARNECLTRIRERMRHPLPFANAGERASSADPVAEAARRADMHALWRAVGALAPQQREALLLREFGGLSYSELAVALGVSVPAVESLLFRARARLRVELKAAAAALGGLLPRLVAGSGAAKVAGVTVAAGILTGGVVESEHRLTHHPVPAAPPHVVRVLPDLPPAPASPSARHAEQAVQRPRPVPVALEPSRRSPAPVPDSPRESEPSPASPDEERTPVVETDETSAATEPAQVSSEQQQPVDTSGSNDGSGDTTSSATTTTTATTTTEQDGGVDAVDSSGS